MNFLNFEALSVHLFGFSASKELLNLRLLTSKLPRGSQAAFTLTSSFINVTKAKLRQLSHVCHTQNQKNFLHTLITLITNPSRFKGEGAGRGSMRRFSLCSAHKLITHQTTHNKTKKKFSKRRKQKRKKKSLNVDLITPK